MTTQPMGSGSAAGTGTSSSFRDTTPPSIPPDAGRRSVTGNGDSGWGAILLIAILGFAAIGAMYYGATGFYRWWRMPHGHADAGIARQIQPVTTDSGVTDTGAMVLGEDDAGSADASTTPTPSAADGGTAAPTPAPSAAELPNLHAGSEPERLAVGQYRIGNVRYELVRASEVRGCGRVEPNSQAGVAYQSDGQPLLPDGNLVYLADYQCPDSGNECTRDVDDPTAHEAHPLINEQGRFAGTDWLCNRLVLRRLP